MNAKRKTKLLSMAVGALSFVLLTAGGILFFGIEETPIEESSPGLEQGAPPGAYPTVTRDGPGLKPRANVSRQRPSGAVDIQAKGEENAKGTATAPSRHIEEIKQRIYERNIEHTDQIALLDELVQTGDKDTREFWGDGWTSVDDWKDDKNGFTLEKKDDGTMVFNPDAATASKYTFFENPLPYTYDEANREFVNEVDYYGKTIYNVAKFINDDVLVMMTISGTKVDLNIYQKNAAQE